MLEQVGWCVHAICSVDVVCWRQLLLLRKGLYTIGLPAVAPAVYTAKVDAIS